MSGVFCSPNPGDLLASGIPGVAALGRAKLPPTPHGYSEWQLAAGQIPLIVCLPFVFWVTVDNGMESTFMK